MPIVEREHLGKSFELQAGVREIAFIGVWLLGGLIIFCQGVIGLYLARVYLEVTRRPITIMRCSFVSTSASPNRTRR